MNPSNPPTVSPDITTWRKQSTETYVEEVYPEDDPAGRCRTAQVIRLGKTTYYLSNNGERGNITRLKYKLNSVTIIRWERNQDADRVWWTAVKQDASPEVIARSFGMEPIFSMACTVEKFLIHLHEKPFDFLNPPAYTIELK